MSLSYASVSSSEPASDGLDSRTFTIHVECGSLFNESGWSRSKGFASTTSPLIGANSSETALTDSIDPKDRRHRRAANFGQLDKDHIAELLLGVIGDADLAVSPAMRIHS